MAHHKTPIAAALVLLAAGVATANMLAGPSAGLVVSGGALTAQSSPAATAPSTVGPSTGSPAVVTGTTTGTASTTTPSITPSTSGPATDSTTLAIEQIVSITRSVAPGAPVNAFAVPAGRQLIVTDVLVTNPGTAPACGAAISPSGAAATTTTGAGESGTGLLCVPAQTSLNLGLTTGLEFAAGQGVVLANTTTAEVAAATPLHYHLRGFLVTTGG